MNRTVYILLLCVCFCVLGVKPATAQYYDSYEEEDYDGEYDYDPSVTYHEVQGGNKTKEYKRYRRGRREEELYNGGYRKYGQSDKGWQPGMIGTTGIGKRPGRSGDKADADLYNPNSPNWSGQGSNGMSNEREPGMFNADGSPGGGTTGPGKGSADGDDNQEFGPPPPPDEPDVPVDTAIPLLIAGGILIASLKFYSKKSGTCS